MIPAAPPQPITGTVSWGQPARSAEVADRPLGKTLAVFRGGRAVTIPTLNGQSLASLASTMGVGRLIPGGARSPALGLYLAPTTSGGVCVRAPASETCHHGLLPQGITYSFSSDGAALVLLGLAADDVARVTLGRTTVAVHDNVFTVSRTTKPGVSSSMFGTLVVTYRDGRPPARVAIH